MRDVAALAGVSIKTVSRVVNADPQVKPEYVTRTLDAIEKLGYRRNLTASSLRRADQKSATIGVLLEDVSNPFMAAVHRGIEEVAHERDTLVFAASSDEPEREAVLVSAMASRSVDGYIVVPQSTDHTALQRERRLGRPVVFIDRRIPFDGADSVTVDNRNGAQMAVLALAGSGHERIAFLGELQTVWTPQGRYAGYLEGLGRAGLRFDDGLVRRNLHSIQAAREATDALFRLSVHPTAIFAAQNLITIGAIQTLQARGLQHKVALVGFDDFLLADLLDPPVTVVAQDPGE